MHADGCTWYDFTLHFGMKLKHIKDVTSHLYGVKSHAVLAIGPGFVSSFLQCIVDQGYSMSHTKINNEWEIFHRAQSSLT